MDEEGFKRYLVGELCWEMDQWEDQFTTFKQMTQELLEVISFQGYDRFVLRIEDRDFRVRLSWRQDVPPEIVPILGAAGY